MAVKKSRKFPVQFCDLFTGNGKFSTRHLKGVPFVNGRYCLREGGGVPFLLKKNIQKGKELDLRAELNSQDKTLLRNFPHPVTPTFSIPDWHLQKNLLSVYPRKHFPCSSL